MVDLPTIFFILTFVFIAVIVSAMNGGIIFIRSFLRGMMKLSLFCFIAVVFVSRVSPSVTFNFINQSNEFNQDYAYKSIQDIADHPEGAEKYVIQLEKFIEGTQDIVSGESFRSMTYKY